MKVETVCTSTDLVPAHAHSFGKRPFNEFVRFLFVLGIAVCAFNRPQTRNALSRNIVAQVSGSVCVNVCIQLLELICCTAVM